MGKNEISYKAGLPASQALEHLENLVQSLRKGSVCLQVGGEQLVMGLNKAAPLELEISASEKKGKNRLSLELSWKELKPGEGQSPEMLISSQPPAPDPAPKAPAAASKTPKKKAPAKKAAAPKTKRAAKPKGAAAKKTTRKKAASAKAK
ncbi:MAG: amphi-Trp domain-containing protein [Desulfarculaceae bacterium]|nr:amphi-Trp domain-containing protein [Desulfarculaceae bacterium]MCF8071534.1 amphi-Trp domain-containing protein [Desulfarculaceae bacterium]MCF8102349.1 amphi-Trp domain-containing protein [Desulfarculaceae bacterium]MCF8114813.1 amphi-Trp domain-containing protein [Desulfarculaceae bacterium]